MRLLGNLFWIVITVVFTFLWIVLFEHGPDNFQEGISIEYEKAKDILQPPERRGEPETP